MELELPGSGFSTTSENVPEDVALPLAVSWVEETKVEVRGELLRRTFAPLTKLEPVMEIEKLPRLVEEGVIPVREGVGLRRVTEEESDFVVSAALVATTERELGEGRVEGAV